MGCEANKWSHMTQRAFGRVREASLQARYESWWHSSNPKRLDRVVRKRSGAPAAVCMLVIQLFRSALASAERAQKWVDLDLETAKSFHTRGCFGRAHWKIRSFGSSQVRLRWEWSMYISIKIDDFRTIFTKSCGITFTTFQRFSTLSNRSSNYVFISLRIRFMTIFWVFWVYMFKMIPICAAKNKFSFVKWNITY